MSIAKCVIVAGLLSFATLCKALWNTEPDNILAIYVYWEFPADKYDDFKDGCVDFTELTKKEPGNKYYGFTLRETTAVCKEGYSSGQAFLDHLVNVDAPLQVALTFASITKIEVHGPEAEFAVLKDPLASFPVTYWPLVPSSFNVPAAWKTAADTTLTVFVYWEFAAEDYDAFEAGTADFVSLTKQEPGNVFYGFTLLPTNATCKEAYVSAQAFLDHLVHVDAPLKEALKFSRINLIDAHGPAAELEKLKEPLATFPVKYWALEPGAFYMPCNYVPLDTTGNPTPEDTTLAVMVHWEFPEDKYDDYLAGTKEFTSLTKTEPGCLYYGFTMQSTSAVCKEGYVNAQAFLDHLGNVNAPLTETLKFSSILMIEAHGPAAELEKLKEPLAAFPVTYWEKHPSSYYVAAKYNPPVDTTLAVMVYWEFSAESRAAYEKGTYEFVKLTKMEPENVYYGFTILNTSAVCKEGYKSAEGFLYHLVNVDAPLKEALKIASIPKIEVHGPAEELEKLKEPLAAFPVTYWALEPGAFMKEISCDKPIYYGTGMENITCGNLKKHYKAKCCKAPASTHAPSLKTTCGAAKSDYKLAGCCGSPNKQTMILK